MKILLCCNAGMSSSILVKKIRDVAEKTGEDIEVSAVANASIKNEVGKWDVCLVGPQLIYAVDSIHQQLNIPVASIEPRVYAMADGAAAFELAKKLLGYYGSRRTNITSCYASYYICWYGKVKLFRSS